MRAVRLTVRLTPRGGRDGIEGWTRDEAGRVHLKVRVAAPPVDGAANTALQTVIAKALRVGGSSVRIVGGEHGRMKVLEIDGVGQPELDHAFGTPA
jgi:uncharacterized protein (TIGR00251 family)